MGGGVVWGNYKLIGKSRNDVVHFVEDHIIKNVDIRITEIMRCNRFNFSGKQNI